MTSIRTIALAAIAVVLSATMAFAHDYKLGNLEIHHPFSKAMIPGAEVAGGFMKITNKGTEADRLIKVSGDFAKLIQIHEMKVENDVMKMAELPNGIEIPAGATVELKPGALHVMFMGVATQFKEGDKIKAVLNFEKAGEITVDFVVGPANGAKEHDMKNMKM